MSWHAVSVLKTMDMCQQRRNTRLRIWKQALLHATYQGRWKGTEKYLNSKLPQANSINTRHYCTLCGAKETAHHGECPTEYARGERTNGWMRVRQYTMIRQYTITLGQQLLKSRNIASFTCESEISDMFAHDMQPFSITGRGIVALQDDETLKVWPRKWRKSMKVCFALRNRIIWLWK